MNDQMQHARDVALDILKPSQRDIEHGLELHEHALVIESYGLGLRSPIDPDPVNAAIEAGASDRELQDLTEDMGMTRWALTPELRREYREIWQSLWRHLHLSKRRRRNATTPCASSNALPDTRTTPTPCPTSSSAPPHPTTSSQPTKRANAAPISPATVSHSPATRPTPKKNCASSASLRNSARA